MTRDLLNYANDIAPGKNTAILTVNGKQVQLSDAMTGVIVGNDKITYYNGSAIAGTAAKTLTVTTPRGGTYQITLPDGTKVWLNADSKLEFPSRFDKNVHRIVKLIGEGYFEVAKDARRPFRVVSQGQQVTVLGTHFNISAYTGERIRTTLLEGSVSVRHLEGSIGTRDLLNNTNRRSLPAGRDEGPGVILKPNQQSLLTENSGITVKEVNPEDAIDWKSGYFMFNNESLESGLKRIARWYNVQIVYEDENLKGETFFGRISKFEKISKVFSMLERTDVVRFKIEGNKIFVRKKK